MRILIVKLSSLGDIVHALPVVHDIHRAHPEAQIDWVVEPAFAPLLRRVRGIDRVIECALRRWTRAWWTRQTRTDFAAFRRELRRRAYDLVIDLQGLTKSAVVARLARGASVGLANRTEGASHEWPARWLVGRAIRIEPRIHALDRSRELAARALGYRVEGAPVFGLARESPVADATPTVLFVHGTSRDDKLWPEADWIALGQRAIESGWHVALPQAGAEEAARAVRIASALGARCTVWPVLSLDAVVERMAGVQGVVGVDSGLSHIAVALDLPHVQLYNFPTAWRTGPQPGHGHRHQVSVEAAPAPSLEAVWEAWQRVRPCATA